MKRILMLAMAALGLAFGAKAELKTWTGNAGDGIYQTPSNWNPEGVPSASDDILIVEGNVTYVPGGDWTRAAGSTFTMKGGSFTQTQSIAYMQISGAINIEGGSFSMGTAGQLVLYGSGSITVSGGSFQTKTIDNQGGTIRLSGGEYIVDGNYTVPTGGRVEMSPTAMMTITGELQFNSANQTLNAGTYVANLVAQQGGSGMLGLDGAKLVSKGGHTCGTYGTDPVLNFISVNGNASSYTFVGTETDAEVFSKLFESGRFRLDGETVSKEVFDQKFQISRNGSTITLELVTADADWRVALDGVSNVTANAATLKATVKKVNGTAGAIYYARGTTQAAVESATLADMTFVKSGIAADEQVTVELTDLVDGMTYYVAFALVNGTEIVATTPIASFAASDYDNIYENGAWTKGAPTSGQRLLFKEAFDIPQAGWNEQTYASFTIDVGEGNTVSVADYTGVTLSGSLVLKSGSLSVAETSFVHYSKLVLDGGKSTAGEIDFSRDDMVGKYEFKSGSLLSSGECRTGNKFALNNMIFAATGYVSGGAPITANASRLISTRRDRRGDLPFGLYQSGNFIDFVPGAIADGVIPTSCGYSWTYDFATEEGETDAWPARTAEQIQQALFTERRLTVNGATVDDFTTRFIVLNDEADHSQLVTMYTPMTRAMKGSYTLMNGAVVRLVERVTISGLTVHGADTIFDLNGKNLSVTGKNAFVVNGVTIERGDYTAAQLNALARVTVFRGEGNVSVGKVGFAVIIR